MESCLCNDNRDWNKDGPAGSAPLFCRGRYCFYHSFEPGALILFNPEMEKLSVMETFIVLTVVVSQAVKPQAVVSQVSNGTLKTVQFMVHQLYLNKPVKNFLLWL